VALCNWSIFNVMATGFQNRKFRAGGFDRQRAWQVGRGDHQAGVVVRAIERSSALRRRDALDTERSRIRANQPRARASATATTGNRDQAPDLR
jgi:hypothetical protein